MVTGLGSDHHAMQTKRRRFADGRSMVGCRYGPGSNGSQIIRLGSCRARIPIYGRRLAVTSCRAVLPHSIAADTADTTARACRSQRSRSKLLTGAGTASQIPTARSLRRGVWTIRFGFWWRLTLYDMIGTGLRWHRGLENGYTEGSARSAMADTMIGPCFFLVCWADIYDAQLGIAYGYRASIGRRNDQDYDRIVNGLALVDRRSADIFCFQGAHVVGDVMCAWDVCGTRGAVFPACISVFTG